MKNKILNTIIAFCIERVNVIYNPYLIISTIGCSETTRIIKELKENDITNKEDYLKWRKNFLKELKMFDK